MLDANIVLITQVSNGRHFRIAVRVDLRYITLGSLPVVWPSYQIYENQSTGPKVTGSVSKRYYRYPL